MATKLGEQVTFDIDRLFNGAIDVDWLSDGSGRAERAAESFVFHGPKTHGISQGDIGETTHRLVDTATFLQRVVDRIESRKGNAFTLAIAGFGSGKSHLAVTISQLLASRSDSTRQAVLDHVLQADAGIGKSVAGSCRNIGKVLVITLNGMNNSDLASAFLSQIRSVVDAEGLDVSKLENLRERFKHAANLLRNLDDRLLPRLFEDCGVADKEELIAQLGAFDESVYKKVHAFLSGLGINLAAVRDETAKDVINIAVREFVGKGKHYSHMVVLFDEFGHYMEYATSHPQIAGDGALQHLFEGVQGNDEQVTFVGFVQYELKAYAQRLPSEFKNELNRFITRFDNAEKLYLSSNLETLVASLLQKKRVPKTDQDATGQIRHKIADWYPVSQNYSTWSDADMFSRVIVDGCWPLSPVAMWVLFYLSSSGKYLQQRSALTLLKAALDANRDRPGEATLPPVGLWTNDLQQEFESIEEDSAHGTLLQSYNTVCSKFDAHLSAAEKDVLRSIVLLSQTQLRAESRADADYALEVFSGLDSVSLRDSVRSLQDERNVIEWDNASRSYEILSDNASKPQFLHLLRQKAQEYDEERQAELFCGIASSIPVLIPPECSFANANGITTSEWRFEAKPTHWLRFQLTVGAIAAEMDRTSECQTVEAARGLVIQCYVPSNEDIAAISEHAQTLLRKVARHKPILLVLIQDDELHVLSKAMMDVDILSRLTADERLKFGQLVMAHEQKQRRVLDDCIRKALLARHYITPFDNIEPHRLRDMEEQLFEAAYPKVLPFPFDGYATARGNAAKDCAELTRRLAGGTFSYGDTQSMGIASRNRAQTVLNQAWRVFSKSDGSVVQKPANPVARAIIAEWERQISLAEGLNCAKAIKIACAAPYGANLASAGLLWGVFVQAFQKMLQAQYEGMPVSMQVVAESAFSGNSLDMVYLDGITLFRMTGENGVWDQLIADWTACNTYHEQADFVERIDTLESSSPMPSVLRPQISVYRKMAKEAYEKIDAMDEKESSYIEKLENGLQRQKASLIAYGASLLLSHARELRKDPMWDVARDIEPIVRRVNEAKVQVAALFDTWLVHSQPKGSTQQDLVEFKRDCEDRMARNLKNLEMYDEKDKLTHHVEKVSRSFEQVISAQTAVSEYDSWEVRFADIPEKTPVQQLTGMSKECDNRMEVLKEALTKMKRVGNQHYAQELTSRIERLETIRKRIKEVRKAIDKRAEAIWKTDLTIETVQTIADEISDLSELYQGEDSNLEDFRLMRNVVNAFSDIRSRIDSLQIPQTQFVLLLEETRQEFVSRFEEEEPPWMPDETFDKLADEVMQKRRRASAEWLAQIKTSFADVEDMSLQDAEGALREVVQTPPYFMEEKDGEARDVIKRKLEKHLESKGVEWLVEKYKALSTAAQKRFKEKIRGL